MVAKRSARDTKIKTMNQIRHLGFTAPDELRERLAGVSRKDLAATAAALRPRDGGDQVAFATKTALCLLGRRVLALDAEKEHLGDLLAKLVEKTAPELLDLYGVGIDTAAALLVTAGDNPERVRSEAAWAHLCGAAPIRGVLGQGDALAPGPGRGPPGQRRPLRHRHNPHGRRQAHPGLRRAPPGRRQDQARHHQDPEALRGPGGLPLPSPGLRPSPRRAWPENRLAPMVVALRTICRPAAVSPNPAPRLSFVGLVRACPAKWLIPVLPRPSC